jgi:hypothetical protein
MKLRRHKKLLQNQEVIQFQETNSQNAFAILHGTDKNAIKELICNENSDNQQLRQNLR